MRNRKSALWLVGGLGLGVAVLSLALAGCAKRGKSVKAQERSNLAKLATLYYVYISRHQGKPPASEAEFKTFINSLSAEDMKKAGVNDVDSIFTSERDGQPYVVLYGADAARLPASRGAKAPDIATAGTVSFPVIAYEQQGRDGKRFIARAVAGGGVQEVDETEFKQQVPNSRAPAPKAP